MGSKCRLGPALLDLILDQKEGCGTGPRSRRPAVGKTTAVGPHVSEPRTENGAYKETNISGVLKESSLSTNARTLDVTNQYSRTLITQPQDKGPETGLASRPRDLSPETCTGQVCVRRASVTRPRPGDTRGSALTEYGGNERRSTSVPRAQVPRVVQSCLPLC